jgi:conjugal transfer pilus assembly protein TrbC
LHIRFFGKEIAVQARFEPMIVISLCTVLANGAHSAEPRWPTPGDIDAARSRWPLPSLDGGVPPAPPAVPTVKPKRPALELEDMARRYAANRDAFAGATPAQPQLKIFVTLAMAELLAAQAAKTQATLVIRGLKDDSLSATLAAVHRLVGERAVDWQIDPPAFTRFAITHAPTFVLTRPSAGAIEPRGCTTDCDKAPSFVSVSGDVSLDYALGVIARANPAFASDAQRFLSKLGTPLTP